MRLAVGKYNDGMQCWNCTVMDGDMRGCCMFVDINVSGDLSWDDTVEGMIIDVDYITPSSYIAEGVMPAND